MSQFIFDARKEEGIFKVAVHQLMQQHMFDTCRLDLADCSLRMWKTRQLKRISSISIFPVNMLRYSGAFLWIISVGRPLSDEITRRV